METIIKNDIQAVSTYLSDILVSEIAEVLRERGRAKVVLAGGSTYLGAYRRLADAPEINWPKVSLFFGDERCVSPADPRSNYGQSAQVWWERLPAERRPAVHRIHGEDGPRAAEAYAELLPADFDIVLLGMGPDGHTASLFPGSMATIDPTQLVVSTAAELEPRVDRITLTPRALNRGNLLIIAATGTEKADAVAKLLAGTPRNDCPATLLHGKRETIVVLDKNAAPVI